jgi:hypothetical protein
MCASGSHARELRIAEQHSCEVRRIALQLSLLRSVAEHYSSQGSTAHQAHGRAEPHRPFRNALRKSQRKAEANRALERIKNSFRKELFSECRGHIWSCEGRGTGVS